MTGHLLEFAIARKPRRRQSKSWSARYNVGLDMSSIRRVVTAPQTASGTYTATHYVAPFASVSGAVNDYADRGAASWASAVNSGSPTTLGTAMARAVAGNKVQCAAGTYVGLVSGSRFVAAFTPTNSGTVGNPIAFFAATPAATNVGSTSLYSHITRPSAPTGGTSIGPILNVFNSKHDIIFDGFFFDEDVSAAGPSEGMVQLAGGATRCSLRRLLFDRGNLPPQYGGGYNGNCVYWEITEDCVMTDCYFYGDSGNTSHQNNGALELYNCINPIIEYNTCIDVGWALHCKTEAPQSQIGVEWHMENVHIRYNKIRSYAGINNQTSRSTYIYNNEIEITANGYAGVRWSNTAANNFISCLMSFYHNTIILPGSAGSGMLWQGASSINAASEWHSNLVVVSGAGNCCLTMMPEDSAAWPGGVYGDIGTVARFDYNYYSDTTPRWSLDTTVRTSFSGSGGYQEDCATFGLDAYGNSVEQHSQHGGIGFVDSSARNYKLTANGQNALTASLTGGKVGCWVTDLEEIGVRAIPTYA